MLSEPEAHNTVLLFPCIPKEIKTEIGQEKVDFFVVGHTGKRNKSISLSVSAILQLVGNGGTKPEATVCCKTVRFIVSWGGNNSATITFILSIQSQLYFYKLCYYRNWDKPSKYLIGFRITSAILYVNIQTPRKVTTPEQCLS